MSTNLTRESQELLGTPRNEAEQIANGYRSAKQRFGGGGLNQMLERRMSEETQARGTETGLANHDLSQKAVTTHTKVWKTRDDGLEL